MIGNYINIFLRGLILDR